MDPKTGELFNVDDDKEKARKLLVDGDLSDFPRVTEEEAHRRGLIAVSREQAHLLANMTPEQRRAWAANVRKQASREELRLLEGIHPAARRPGDDPDELRQARNARKRARKAHRPS